MLDNYEEMVRDIFSDIMDKYNLEFVVYNNDEFFLVGNGFALDVFVDRRDRYSDMWYVSLSGDGIIRFHTLKYISLERFTPHDRSIAGKPQNEEERIEANFKIKAYAFLNHCHDILSGDEKWLENYPSKGMRISHMAEFLAPYFRKQGYEVKAGD